MLILTLHVTGTTVLRIASIVIESPFSDAAALRALALAIAGMSPVIICTALLIYLIDSDSRADSLKHLRKMAHNDVVTGLAYRASFNERLNLEIRLTQEAGEKLALIRVGLNRAQIALDGGHALDNAT